MKIRYSNLRGHTAITGLDAVAPSAALLNLAFAQSEQVVSANMLSKKMRPSNAFVGKVPSGEQFPIHSGTRIKMRRMERMGIPNTGWHPVDDELCATNAHLSDPDVIENGGSDFFYSLVSKDLVTDPINLSSLALRAVPDKEISHIEEGIQSVSLYVHEMFQRDRYHFFCGNKVVGVLPLTAHLPPTGNYNGSDDNILNNGWVFEIRANGEMDEQNLRVCVDPTDVGYLKSIATITGDLLDYATVRLAYEGEPYMGDTQLFDTLLAEQRQYKNMVIGENEAMNEAASHSETYDMLDLQRTYGTARLFRNYAIRYDAHSPRFYPDTVFNAALIDGDGYEFDEEDPESWPRFNRVYPYIKKRAARGVKWVTNPSFIRAPFGLNTIFQPRVMDVMSFPAPVGYGSATTGETFGGWGYDGTAKWVNKYDRIHNKHEEIGHWSMRFRNAARPGYTEEGFSFFCRINTTAILEALATAPPANLSDEDVSPFCAGQAGGTSNPRGANAGANGSE